jgi:hypothetical protein
MRKSKQQRIDEGNALIASIKQDPILAEEQSWLLRFLGDLVSKFNRGKGGTSRQRSLFDEKIAAGIPARKVNTHVAQPEVLKAEAALKVLQTQSMLYSWEIRVGGEIVANGLKYNLSAKQLALLGTIVYKAEQVENQHQCSVNPEMLEEAELLCNLADTYLGLTAKKSKDIDILRSAIGSGIGFSVDQLEAGRVAVSGELKKYNKFKGWYTPGLLVRYIGVSPAVEMAMVVDEPSVANHGNNTVGWQTRASKSTRIPLIVNGELIYALPSRVVRYTKKELKQLGAE